MQKLVLSFLFIVSGLVFGQTQNFHTQMQERYDDVDDNYDLDCLYYNPKEFKLVVPQTQTYFEGTTLKREFTAQTLRTSMNFTFEIKVIDDKPFRQITFENGETQLFEIEDRFDREFYVRFSETDSNFNSMFEPNTIHCSLNFARDTEYALTSEKTHINVHPHNNYDRFAILRKRENKYMVDASYKSIILLEDYNIKGAYIDLVEFLLTQEVPQLKKSDFPTHLFELQTADIVVSPAGVNTYKIEADDIDVTYTGGNFNFCMFNNTREILNSYIRSTHEGTIDLTFDMNEIIAQANGAVGMIDLSAIEINVKKTNYLKDILSKPRKAQKYFKKYFKYYKSEYFKNYGAFFRTVTLKMTSKHYTEEFVIEGTGSRDINVNFKIINEN